MSVMIDIENLWLVMAIDVGEIESVVERIVLHEEKGLDGLPVQVMGVIQDSMEKLHAQMAIDFPQLEVIGYWKMSELMSKEKTTHDH